MQTLHQHLTMLVNSHREIFSNLICGQGSNRMMCVLVLTANLIRTILLVPVHIIATISGSTRSQTSYVFECVCVCVHAVNI